MNDKLDYCCISDEEAKAIVDKIQIANTINWDASVNFWSCSKCKGWGLPSFKFCPHCGCEVNNKEDPNNE